MDIDNIRGILLVDKPVAWTSHDIVAKIRGILRSSTPSTARIKVGHAGTLDPFATGLLIVLVGSATKNQDSYMKQDKTYTVGMLLGYKSTTADPEGEIKKSNSKVLDIDEDKIKEIFQHFIGNIEQIPPAFSAIKIDGKRAYKLAREGKEVELKTRKITINTLELISFDKTKSYLKFRANVSSGTYIRSLVEDIGKSFGTDAYCTDLRRETIGNLSIDQSVSVNDLNSNNIVEHLR